MCVRYILDALFYVQKIQNTVLCSFHINCWKEVLGDYRICYADETNCNISLSLSLFFFELPLKQLFQFKLKI